MDDKGEPSEDQQADKTAKPKEHKKKDEGKEKEKDKEKEDKASFQLMVIWQFLTQFTGAI